MFEGKVKGFASHLSVHLTGVEEWGQTFLMVLNADGTVRTLHFECLEGGWLQLTERLDQAETPYLFYDPFEGPEYTYLSWRGIDRSTMERLIGGRFEDADFVKVPGSSSRAGDLKPPNKYPETWGVMF
mgnify:CR=1 FL=1